MVRFSEDGKPLAWRGKCQLVSDKRDVAQRRSKGDCGGSRIRVPGCPYVNPLVG